MRNFRLSFVLAVVACSVLVGTGWLTAGSASAAAGGSSPDQFAATTLRELAQARAATARYHDVADALADGYVRVSPFVPGEGFHYTKGSLVDCTFDPEQPESLHYAFRPNGTDLKLVGVEYLVPTACSPSVPPDGFTGDADEWEQERPGGVSVWNLNAWIWLNNPDGIFAERNPLLVP